MIGSIRKHSKWLWWVIAGLTIISFVVFMGSGPARNANGGGEGSYGSIYGREITGAELAQGRNDFYISFLVNNGEWPDKNRNATQLQMDQQIYLNILLARKAKSFGIVVPDDSVLDAASQMLRSAALARSFGTPNQAVPMDKFAEYILKPKGFTALDFMSAVRQQLTIEQLRLTLGLSGALVTPQEASALYDHERQEVSAQAVFFSSKNYLPQIYTTAADIGQFYTNNMAYYRLPDRIVVDYVFFNVTNHLASAEKAITNLSALIDANLKKVSTMEEFKNLTPEETKTKLRSLIIRERAYAAAADEAKDFVKVLWSMDPAKSENIAAVAKQKNLTVKRSAPFAAEGTSAEFAAVPAMEREAWKLNNESPFTGTVAGEDGIYVAALAGQVPSSIPSLAEIKDRVTEDLRGQLARQQVVKAGTNFYFSAAVQVATGKTFAAAAVAAGQTPVTLSPFSLSSAEVPEADGHADVRELKQVAFSTAMGGVSPFVPTADGGFVLHVQKMIPADATKRAAELPQILSQIRRGRESEAFNIWVNNEASRELARIPAFQKNSAAN